MAKQSKTKQFPIAITVYVNAPQENTPTADEIIKQLIVKAKPRSKFRVMQYGKVLDF